MIELDDERPRKPRKLRESDIEEYLVKRVATLGGIAEKFSSPARRSVPDRIVSWLGAQIHFVECKAPGEEPTPAQARDHARRRAMGFLVIVVDSKEAVDAYLRGAST